MFMHVLVFLLVWHCKHGAFNEFTQLVQLPTAYYGHMHFQPDVILATYEQPRTLVIFLIC